jgi:hypothetical protein
MQAAPEAPLWALLDRIGLPFRDPLGDLVAAHGTTPCVWLPSLPICTLPAQPLIHGLSRFETQVHPGVDPTLPVFQISAQYRVHSAKTMADHLVDRRCERNFADVTAALTRILGPGSPAASSNTLGLEWRFGAARLWVLGFPPRLNPGANSRHGSDPGSQTEAGLHLSPGWMPPLTAAEQAWLWGFEPLIRCDISQVPCNGLAPPWRRLPGDFPQAAAGFGPVAQGDGFVIVLGGFVQLLPRAHLTGLVRSLASPARGGGYAALELLHAPPGIAGLRGHRLHLMSASFDEDALAAEADLVARSLDLPCRVERFLDD